VAPKIVSLQIPIDKIGEVIGPKGKVINTLQQETGADIAVDDDGVVGTVTSVPRTVAPWKRLVDVCDDPRPAHARSRCDLSGSRRQHRQVRRVREHHART